MAKPQWYPGSWADEVERADEEAAAAKAALQISSQTPQQTEELQPFASCDRLPRGGSVNRSATASFTPASDRRSARSSSAIRERHMPASNRSPLLPTPVDLVPDANAYISDGKKRGITPSRYRERKKRNEGSLAGRDRSRSVERPCLAATLPRSLSCHSPSVSQVTDREARCPNGGSGFGRFVAAVGANAASAKAHPKINPFGDAKPREVLLAKRGLDWRQIDLQLEQRIASRKEIAEGKDQTKPRPKHQDKENKYRDNASYRARELKDQQAAVQDLQTFEKLRNSEEKRRHRAVSAPRRFPHRECSKLEPAQAERTALLFDRANYAPILHETPNLLSDCRAVELDRRFLSQKYSQTEAHNIAAMHPHNHKSNGIDPSDSPQMKRADRTMLPRSVKRFADFLCRRVSHNERVFAGREQHTGLPQQLFHEIQPHAAFQLSGHYPGVLPLRPDVNFHPYEAGQIRGTRDVFIEANESAMSYVRSRQGKSTRTGHGGRR